MLWQILRNVKKIFFKQFLYSSFFITIGYFLTRKGNLMSIVNFSLNNTDYFSHKNKTNIKNQQNAGNLYLGFTSAKKSLNIENLKAIYLNRPALNTSSAKHLSFMGKPTHHIDEENGTAVIRVKSDGNDKIIAHWGVDGFKQPPQEIMPEGSEIKDGAAETLMSKDGDYRQIKIPYENEKGEPVFKKLNYVLYYPDKDQWDSNDGKNYNLRVDSQQEPSSSKVLDPILELEGREFHHSHRWEKVKSIAEANTTPDDMKTIGIWLEGVGSVTPMMGKGTWNRQSAEYNQLGQKTHNSVISNLLQNTDDRQGKFKAAKIILEKIPAAGTTSIPADAVRMGILVIKDNFRDSIYRDPFLADSQFHWIAHQQSALQLAAYARAYGKGLYAKADGKNPQEAFINYLKNNNYETKKGDQYSFEKGSYFAQALQKKDKNSKPVFPSFDVWLNDPAKLIDIAKSKIADNGIKSKLDGIWNEKNDLKKLGRFFEIYGDVIEKRFKMNLKSVLNNAGEVEGLKVNEMLDKEHERPGVDMANQALKVRTNLINNILDPNNKDVGKTEALVLLDNQMESYINSSAEQIYSDQIGSLSDAKKTTLNVKNENIQMLQVLIKNEALTSSPNDKQELELININLDKNLFKLHKSPTQSQAKQILTDLIRLDRLTTTKSDNIASDYRPVLEQISNANNTIANPAEKINEVIDNKIRSSIPFHIAKITDQLIPVLKNIAEESPQTVVSAGVAAGKVVQVKDLQEVPSNADDYKICFADTINPMQEPPDGVKAIITKTSLSKLSHIGIRCRNKGIVTICIDDSAKYRSLKKQYSQGDLIKLTTLGDNIAIKKVTQTQVDEINKPSEALEGQQEAIKPVNLNYTDNVVNLDKMNVDDFEGLTNIIGAKGANLAKMTKKLKKSGVTVPEFFSIPFSTFDKVLKINMTDSSKAQTYNKLLTNLNKKSRTTQKEDTDLKEMRNFIINKIEIPPNIMKVIMNSVSKLNLSDDDKLMVRSSTNGEDGKKLAGAGLYDSESGVKVKEQDIAKAIKQVWASKWTDRAFNARIDSQIPHNDLQVSVVIQRFIDPDYSFVVHTSHTDPEKAIKGIGAIEIMKGHGEGIVGGSPGNPHEIEYDKTNIKHERLANKSFRFVLDHKQGGLKKVFEDYRNDIFSDLKHPEKYQSEVKKIINNSNAIKKVYGTPQDIEGCIKSGKVYIVQTRPQVGLQN